MWGFYHVRGAMQVYVKLMTAYVPGSEIRHRLPGKRGGRRPLASAAKLTYYSKINRLTRPYWETAMIRSVARCAMLVVVFCCTICPAETYHVDPAKGAD